MPPSSEHKIKPAQKTGPHSWHPMPSSRLKTPPPETFLTLPEKNCFFFLNTMERIKQNCQLMRDNWGILGSSDPTSSLYRSRLVCGSSRNPRLLDFLVRSSLPLNPNFGKVEKSQNICVTSDCRYCNSIDTSGHIISKKLGKKFTSKCKVCCKSHSIVYCLTCKI